MDSSSLTWISGASSGIGAALAAGVPHGSGPVIDISRSGGAPGTTHLAADLSDPSSWPLVADDMATRMAATAPRRAVFIHNAATLDPVGPAHAVDPAAYTRQVLLNSAAPQVLGAAFLSAVAATPSVEESVLVQISSGAATSVYQGWSAYGAGKAAVDQWVRTAGAEQMDVERGTVVVSIAPGVVATAMQDQIRAQDIGAFPEVERFRQLLADGSLSSPEEAAAAIWMIVRGAERGQNGSVMDVRRLGPG